MEATEQTFPSWDGAELFYRAWIARKPANKALLLFHRGHEHSGRWQETADSLGLDNVAIFAWDARGHGRSPGERGTANSLHDVIKDVDAFVRHISRRHSIGLENMIVLAHSLAAVTVTAWVHDYAPPIRAMILATAAFHVKLYIPFAIPALQLFRPRFVKSYVKAKMLTHDREQAAAYDSDSLIFRRIAVNVLLDLVREFVLYCFAKPKTAPSFMNADKSGHTWREYERLRNNGDVKFGVARAGLKLALRLSHGIEIGWRSGFDSGLSLDYVYKNEPGGSGVFGRLIDKSYLNSVGWRGIRERKKNLEKMLRDLILKVHRENRAVRIVDIAAGAGRYVFETIRALPEIPIGATLCDYRQENVDAARSLADELNLDGAIIARRGDAFHRESLAKIQPRATIGIVSGLYELFPSNDAVLNSLRGLAEAIEPGGYLIYTSQPWHPQVEFIAHVLRNREGERWVMRRRTTAEIDELVGAVGFEKIDMEIDQWGMFTVSVAKRA